MRKKVFHLLVAALSLTLGIAVGSLWKGRKEKVAQQTAVSARPPAPISSVVIQPEAPLSISSVTRATKRVFNVEVVNTSGKPIKGYGFVYRRKCNTDVIPGGGWTLLTERQLEPGKTATFEAGEEDPVRETEIQSCIDTASEIEVKIIEVTFSDGAVWHPARANKTLEITPR